ncbi:MAG: hypothetical protein K8L99_03495 [Anaerolineae bacterium]|nr:hypothetical protein [Anaerolineae bacterium]
MRKVVFLAMLILGLPLSAQAQERLVGPVVAVENAEQDRIILYDMGSQARRELTFGSVWHRIWGFSPDGCRVLLALGDDPDTNRLYSARLDGSDLRELVSYSDLPPEDWSAWNPQWSPDGTRIAFTLITDTAIKREYHIAWIDAAGGVPQLYSASGDEHEPVWSPDGRWLAYIAYEERVAGADISSTAAPTAVPPPGQSAPQLPLLREADLWVVSADGATKYRLTAFDTGSVRAPRWSPDGELIGFVYSPSAANDQFWMIANQVEAIPTQLSYQWSLILDTTWLPDSSAMLASVRDFHDMRENLLWHIPLIGVADDDATPYEPRLDYADYPRFSADGRWLALRSAYNLAVIDTSDRSTRLVDEDVYGNTPPVWTPAEFRGEASCAY